MGTQGTCTINCEGKDACKDGVVECNNDGFDCFVYFGEFAGSSVTIQGPIDSALEVTCFGDKSCEGSTSINAFDSTDLTVDCFGAEACKGNIQLNFGYGVGTLKCTGEPDACQGAGAQPGTTTKPPKWTQLPTGLQCFTKYKFGGGTLSEFGTPFGSGYIAELDCYADKEAPKDAPASQMTGCSTIVDTAPFNKDPIYRSGEQVYYNTKGASYPICSAYHGDGQAIGISARCCKATEDNDYEFKVAATPFTYDWNTYCFNISCGTGSNSGQHMGCTGWVGTEDIGEWSNAFIGNKNHDENGCYTTRHDAKEIVSTHPVHPI